MKEVKSIFKNKNAFSTVEIILSIAVFSLVILGVSSALSYSLHAQADANQESKANFLLEEALEATGNIKDSSFANLINGTYGLAIISGRWAFAGTSDSVDGYSRSVTVTTVDTNTRDVVATITWNRKSGGSRSITATQRFTDWERVITPPNNWALLSVQSTLNLTSGTDALRVKSNGNYVYVAKIGSSANFTVVDVTNLSAPVERGTISVLGTISDMAVSGNYVYLSSSDNNAEITIVNVTNPLSPTIASTINLNGNSDASGVWVVGTTLFITRVVSGGADGELLAYNITNPSTPTLISQVQFASNHSRVVVDGNFLYTTSNANNAESNIYNITNPAAITYSSGLDLPTGNDATNVAYYGNAIALNQLNTLRLVNVTNPLAPVLLGSYSPGGTIFSIWGDPSRSYIFMSTSGSPQFRVLNVSNPLSVSIVGSLTYTGNLSDIYFDSTLDRVFAVGSNDTQELVIYRPN